MKAAIDGVVIAYAPEAELIGIEGNSYCPPSSFEKVGRDCSRYVAFDKRQVAIG